MHHRMSRCSAGQPLTFVYYPGFATALPQAISSLVARFSELMHGSGRLWSPYNWPLEERRFMRRLEMATAGQLVPVDHVKSISRGSAESLFEIRWDVDVLEQPPGGGRLHRTVPVRLYHAEPSGFSDAFVGLYLHEKDVETARALSITARQNQAIGIAVARYHAGRAVRWGLP